MSLIDGFAPALRMRPPLLLVYELGRREPDVPREQVARLEHVTGSHVENIHDQLVKFIDEIVIRLFDRADLNFHIGNRPGFVVDGKVGTLEQIGLAPPNRKDRLVGVSRHVSGDLNRVRFVLGKGEWAVFETVPQNLKDEIFVCERTKPDLTHHGHIRRDLPGCLVNPTPLSGNGNFYIHATYFSLANTLLGTDDGIDPSGIGVTEPGNVGGEHLKASLGIRLALFGLPTKLGPLHALLALE